MEIGRLDSEPIFKLNRHAPPRAWYHHTVGPLGPLGFAELKKGFPREAGSSSFEKASIRMPYADFKNKLPSGSRIVEL